ncbi:MAG: hypothetical protein PVI98_06560 [Burkholderiales bacterium]|jgi:hypothetical protein
MCSIANSVAVREWARRAALLGFPALAVNNVLVGIWLLHSLRGDTIFNSLAIGTFWIWMVYRQLFYREVSSLFSRDANV